MSDEEIGGLYIIQHHPIGSQLHTETIKQFGSVYIPTRQLMDITITMDSKSRQHIGMTTIN